MAQGKIMGKWVNFSSAFKRWRNLMDCLGLNQDTKLVEFLLDRLAKLKFLLDIVRIRITVGKCCLII